MYQEREITDMGERYWADKDLPQQSRQQHPHEAPLAIGLPQVTVLKEIEKICRRHHTDVQWVVGPTFKQEQLNRHDILVLCQIFGTTHVHDYSAAPQFYDYHWYYDQAHYRRAVGKKILQVIYKTPCQQ